MNDDFLNIKDQQVLHTLKEYLEHDGIQSNVIEYSEALPVNLLLVRAEEDISVNVMYVPLPEDHFTEIRLLQLYSTLTMNATPERRNDLLVLLNEVNNQSPLGSFVLTEKGELGFKYIYPISRFEIPQEDSFRETFSLYLNCLVGLRKVLMHVNDGTLSLADALKDIMPGR